MDNKLLEDILDYLWTIKDTDDKADELFWRILQYKESKDKRYVQRAI